MRQAGSTAAGELSAECFSCAMQADSCITGCHASLRREVADAESIEVHTADCRSILRLQGLDQAQHALADDRLQLAVRRVGIFDFGSKSIECATLRILPAVVVRNRIAKNAVEPCGRRRRASEGGSMVKAPDERFLENVFRFLARSQPALQERQKARMVVQQCLQYLWRSRVALGHLCGSRAPRVVSIYSHPHPQPQPPSPQGQSAPQVQLQPQGHSLGVFSRFGIVHLLQVWVWYHLPSSYLLTHRSPKYYTFGAGNDHSRDRGPQ